MSTMGGEVGPSCSETHGIEKISYSRKLHGVIENVKNSFFD